MSRIVDAEGREMAALARLVELAGRDILDVGCGDGRLSFLLAEVGGSVVGIDPDAAAIDRARRRASPARAVSFVAEDVNAVSAPWLRAFDVVVFSRSL